MSADNLNLFGASISITAIAAGFAWAWQQWQQRETRKEQLRVERDRHNEELLAQRAADLDEREKRLNEANVAEIERLRTEMKQMQERFQARFEDLAEVNNRQMAALHAMAATIPAGHEIFARVDEILGKPMFAKRRPANNEEDSNK